MSFFNVLGFGKNTHSNSNYTQQREVEDKDLGTPTLDGFYEISLEDSSTKASTNKTPINGLQRLATIARRIGSNHHKSQNSSENASGSWSVLPRRNTVTALFSKSQTRQTLVAASPLEEDDQEEFGSYRPPVLIPERRVGTHPSSQGLGTRDPIADRLGKRVDAFNVGQASASKEYLNADFLEMEFDPDDREGIECEDAIQSSQALNARAQQIPGELFSFQTMSEEVLDRDSKQTTSLGESAHATLRAADSSLSEENDPILLTVQRLKAQTALLKLHSSSIHAMLLHSEQLREMARAAIESTQLAAERRSERMDNFNPNGIELLPESEVIYI